MRVVRRSHSSSGRRSDAERVTYCRDDPDAVAYRLRLAAHESVTSAELLGASRLSTQLADLRGCRGRRRAFPGAAGRGPTAGRPVDHLGMVFVELA